MTILIIESVIYIFVGIIISFLLRDKEFKKIKRLILLSYLIIGIAVYSILYFILLSAAVLLSAAAVLRFYD
ncbi:hypothetical protein ACMCNP_00105 [Candidatus Acidulodesulfobacterium sp. H_13]|uniref:hypothetical protein n=1 Tax=Candidatus Acidulodesulfobacterium sp. H_13 TaxID=3395470 RepID=UPI003AF8F973